VEFLVRKSDDFTFLVQDDSPNKSEEGVFFSGEFARIPALRILCEVRVLNATQSVGFVGFDANQLLSTASLLTLGKKLNKFFESWAKLFNVHFLNSMKTILIVT
jgi:hypothetical protein